MTGVEFLDLSGADDVGSFAVLLLCVASATKKSTCYYETRPYIIQ